MPVTLVCDQCHRPFSTPLSRQARGARFCSKACCNVAKRQPIADRFWDKVNKQLDPPPTLGAQFTACWEWQGMRQEHGYGRVRESGGAGSRYAHRVAWELTNGPIPAGRQVLHKCDNPPCCRPDHLFLGNQAANNADRDSKGRTHRGERTGGVRLTAKQVQAIRAAHATGTMSRRALARAYGVSHSTVDDVLNGKTWKHV